MAGRVVAELGRPETPEETAARKAEASRIHRSSRTARNLVAALLATLAVVAVLVLAVPRGDVPPPSEIDVTAVASRIGASEDRDLVVPAVPGTWRVNAAGLQGDDVSAWTIVYVPTADSGFLRVVQGLDADAGWAERELHGTDPDGTVEIDGVVWDRYEPDDPSAAGNISYALSTEAGDDVVLIAGSTGARIARQAAAGVADEILALREAAR